MSQTLQLRKFDPATIGDGRICVIIAKRGSGKSFLTFDLMHHKKHIPFGVVMSGTEDGNGAFKKVMPDSFVYSQYEPDVLARLIKRQKRLCKNNVPNSGVFLIIDDCTYDKKMLKDPNMRAVFMNGRHWKIWLVMTMQYMMDMGPDMRTNIDYVFVLRENIIQNRERLYKSFFGIFPTFDMFNQVMDQCTENYECMVLDNTSHSNRIEDCVFHYKARDLGKFKMGSPEFWQVHRSVYNPRYDDDEDEKPSKKKAAVARKKGPLITVKKTYALK